LNIQKLVERLANLSVTEVPKMERWGAQLMKRNDKFLQYQLPGPSYPRSLLQLATTASFSEKALLSLSSDSVRLESWKIPLSIGCYYQMAKWQAHWGYLSVMVNV